MKNMLKELSLTHGTSGHEALVADKILTELEGKCELKKDALGNIIVFKKGKRTPNKKIMLSAHMDEVGFVITYIDESGLLRFSPCGGIDTRVIVGRRVIIDGNITGVIGTKALHQKNAEEREKVLGYDKLYIDIGAKDSEQAKSIIKPGMRAVFDSEFIELGQDRFACKAFDDRAGCVMLIEILKEFDEFDLYVAFTVQEETGLAGAKVAANAILPDVAIALETTTAGDVGNVPKDKQVCQMGKGAVISFMDKGTVYDSDLYNLFLSVGEKHSIPVQSKLGVYGGNESRELQVAGNGVKVAAVSLPCRYIHSATNMLQESDITNTVKLLLKALPEIESL